MCIIILVTTFNLLTQFSVSWEIDVDCSRCTRGHLHSPHGRLGVKNVETTEIQEATGGFSVDWSITHLLTDPGRVVAQGLHRESSSLPCTASMLVLARVKGAVGRAMPIRTGTIRDSATLQSSSTAYGNRAWKTRLHFPMGCGMKLLKEKQKHEAMWLLSFRRVNIFLSL